MLVALDDVFLRLDSTLKVKQQCRWRNDGRVPGSVPNEACLLPDWICSYSDVVDDLLNLWVEI